MPYVLAIDQGTTSTRAVVYDEQGQPVGSASMEFTQHFPQPGWVEHDADEIWQSVLTVIPQALKKANLQGSQIAAVGITNQRETVVLWDKTTGRPAARAIVWQDRRTTDFCRKQRDREPWVFQKTGLVLDPYFSATKIRWILEKDPGLRSQAEKGQLLCGTMDSWLLWNLSGGKVHATDMTNASRTLLLDIGRVHWDEELCDFFGVPLPMLPRVQPSSSDFGMTAALAGLPAGIPITGMAGDQQAALFGQGGFDPGDAKCTYGTGAFFLQHTGSQFVHSKNRLLSSLAATTDNKPQYVLEGSVFIAGAAVQWLRDGLKLIHDSAETHPLAEASDPQQPIFFVPGFVGLGAPHWVPEARGVIFGLTRNTSSADLARATLEGVAFQVTDLLEASNKDSHQPLSALRVDGGMARNPWFLQCQADLAGIPVIARPNSEATALGAAFLAGLKVGVWAELSDLKKILPAGQTFAPLLPAPEREKRHALWQRAVRAVIEFYAPNEPRA